MAVLDPVELRARRTGPSCSAATRIARPASAPVHPQQPELGERRVRPRPARSGSSATTSPRCRPRASSASSPATRCASSTATSIECTGCEKDAAGRVTAVLASVVPDTKSGTPGADAVKVKGTITWVGAHDASPAEVRLYDRLFTEAQPDAGGKDFKASLNPASLRVVTGYRRSRRSPNAAAETALPVRAPRLLRRRPRTTTRPAGRCSTASRRCAKPGLPSNAATRRHHHDRTSPASPSHRPRRRARRCAAPRLAAGPGAPRPADDGQRPGLHRR